MRFNIKNIKRNENSLYKCFRNIRQIKKKIVFLFNRERRLPTDCIKRMKHLKPFCMSSIESQI